jgi:hypothetical protein
LTKQEGDEKAMSVNAREEQYEHVELFGKPALFTDSRIDRSTVPEGFHCYDLRGSDYDPGKPVTVENQVAVNHAGTVLTAEPVTIPKEGFRRLRGKLNFLGECLTLPEFCEEHGIALPPDNRKFILRPASPSEAGLFSLCRRSRTRRWAPSAMSALISGTTAMSSGTPGILAATSR